MPMLGDKTLQLLARVPARLSRPDLRIQEGNRGKHEEVVLGTGSAAFRR